MRLDSLERLYVEELRDLWSAEMQILKALPKMTQAANHKSLRLAFTRNERQSKEHVKRLERIFEDLSMSPKGRTSAGMVGLLEAVAALIKEKPDPDVLDAGLISAAQHVEHYEMAGYGTCRTWARLLSHDAHADVLQRTLNEAGDADKVLTRLAEASINIDANYPEHAREARASGF